MKKIYVLSGFLILLCTCDLQAQDDAAMKAWQNYMTPGEMHTMMALYDGEWNEAIKMYMDTAQAPMLSTATAKYEMIMGGRYQVAKTTGTMMGMPFEGMSVTGYDNSRKLFTATWIDNFGTGTITLEGTLDSASKSLTLKGKGVDPSTGKEIFIKQVTTFIDKDTQQIAMYDIKEGKELKTVEINLTRKK